MKHLLFVLLLVACKSNDVRISTKDGTEIQVRSRVEPGTDEPARITVDVHREIWIPVLVPLPVGYAARTSATPPKPPTAEREP